MNQKELQQKITEYYQKLSPELQEFFSSMNWMKKIEEVSLEYKLSNEQTHSLGVETTLILLGILPIDELPKELFSELKLSKETFNKINLEVYKNIFEPIKSQLIDVFEKNVNDLARENPQESNNAQKIPDYNLKTKEETSSSSVNLKEAVKNSDYQTKLYSIGGKHKLSIEQMGILDEIITKVIEGEIASDKFENELQSKIKLPEETKEQLIFDLNEAIFKNIREILKNQDQQENKSIDSSKEKLDTVIPIPPYKNDEPPIPPYKNDVIKQEEEPKTEKDIFKMEPNSTFEFIEENKTNNKEILLDEDEENEMLKSSGVDLIGEKLAKPKINSNVISDYSIPKMGSDKHDPYREDI